MIKPCPDCGLEAGYADHTKEACVNALKSRLSKPAKAPLSEDAVETVVERLTFALMIYPNYRVDSRGPAGCIVDALRAVRPEAADLISEGLEMDEVRKRLGIEDS